MPGAFSVCQHCASILRFQRDLSFRLAEESDFDGAPEGFLEAMAEIVSSIKTSLKERGVTAPNVNRLN